MLGSNTDSLLDAGTQHDTAEASDGGRLDAVSRNEAGGL